jgi:integrase
LPGLTRLLHLPETILPLPLEYTEEELAVFFAVTTDRERELFTTFLLTGFREQEVALIFWSDINLKLRTIRVTSKPHLGFSPKRWEEREIPIPLELAKLLEAHPHLHSERFVFPSPRGNREHNMLLKCKAVAERAGLDPEKFDLKTFRSTYATLLLRSGFDVRTVQHWMGHKSLETTMRYLARRVMFTTGLIRLACPASLRRQIRQGSPFTRKWLPPEERFVGTMDPRGDASLSGDASLIGRA